MAKFELTADTWGTIVEFIEAGNYPETAAAVAGIPKRVMREWLTLGAQGDPKYAAFHADVLRADAHAQSTALGMLQTAAGTGDTKAIQWILERRWPAEYGAKVRHIVQQELDGAVARIEALEGAIGAEAVDLVLAALAGECGGGASDSEEGAELH